MSNRVSYTEVEIAVVVALGIGATNTGRLSGIVRWAACKGPASGICDYAFTRPKDSYTFLGETAIDGTYSRPVSNLSMEGIYKAAVTGATVDGTYTFLLQME